MIGIRCGVLPQRDIANLLDSMKVLLCNPASQGKVLAEAMAVLQPAAFAPVPAIAAAGDKVETAAGEAAAGTAAEDAPAAAAQAS